MLSIFWADVKLEAGPDLVHQSFREEELDSTEQLFNRTWCGHDSLRDTAELICKSYTVLYGEKRKAVLYEITIILMGVTQDYPDCVTVPCWGCELLLWPRKCMANCWMGPVRPSSPGTDGGMMRGPEGPSSGAFSKEPRVSSTLSTSSPQGRVISLMSICREQDRT